MTIDDVIEGVIEREGDYVNDPNDRGGETRYGITIATARANGYSGPMQSLPITLARSIYRKRYVIAPGFDKVAAISMPIAAELVDTGANMGPDAAGKILQRALNVLNNRGKDFPDLLVDGDVGKSTRGGLSAFLAKRGKLGETRLVWLLNSLQGERYVSIAEGREPNEAFMFGWLARIAPDNA